MRRFTCVGARRALVLGLVLVMSSYVTHGVRTTPSAQGSADALPDQTTAPSAASGNTYDGQTAPLHPERGQAARDGEAAAAAVAEEEMVKETAVAGSRLPDCTHACGPCFPCKRVMVSLRCAEAAESCPIAYRCMCRGRFFHVPTI